MVATRLMHGLGYRQAKPHLHFMHPRLGRPIRDIERKITKKQQRVRRRRALGVETPKDEHSGRMYCGEGALRGRPSRLEKVSDMTYVTIDSSIIVEERENLAYSIPIAAFSHPSDPNRGDTVVRCAELVRNTK